MLKQAVIKVIPLFVTLWSVGACEGNVEFTSSPHNSHCATLEEKKSKARCTLK